MRPLHQDLARLDSFMDDLKDGHFDEDEEVSQLLREAFAVGLYLE